MFTLGAINGVNFIFDATGHLQEVRIPRQGKVLPLRDDQGLAVIRSERPISIFPGEGLSQIQTYALQSWGRRLTQTLSDGERTWEVYQSRADQRQAAIAWIRVVYRLERPLSWRLSLSDRVALMQQGPGWLLVRLSEGLALRIAGDVPLQYETMAEHGEICGATIDLGLPQGESQVEMVIESRPVYNVADTVVICLPQQLPEASVVVTCIRGKEDNRGKYVPVIDVTPPPLDKAEVTKAGQDLPQKAKELQQVEMEMVRLASMGTNAEKLVLPTGTAPSQERLKTLARQRQELTQEVVNSQAKVLNYTLWQRRWQRIAHLINALSPAQVVCLYPLPPDLAASVAPQATWTFFFWEDYKHHIAQWEETLAAAIRGRTSHIIYFRDLEALGKLAWERLAEQEYRGAFTIPDDPRYYALGVRRALQVGKPLLPRGRAGQKVNLEAATDLVNQTATAPEAVVVEADGSLASLAAALYADYLNAPLFVHPASNPEPVFRQLEAIQQAIEKEELAKQSAAAYAYIGEHKGRFLQDPKVAPDLKQLAASVPVLELPRAVASPYSPQVFAQMLLTYTAAKEQGIASDYRYDAAAWQKDVQQLTDLVTARVDGLVRARALPYKKITVFTVGLPYSFVEGWADKCVGHVLTEPCLTLLHHVLSQNLRPPAASFVVIFDPGFFRANESAEIKKRLRYGNIYPLYLKGSAASPEALQVYPSLLPLEALLLEVPGDETGLIFMDQQRRLQPFSAMEMEIACDFASAPLIFTHASFSWPTVGPACLSAGARGYVGTLWSVESEPATELALQVLGEGTACREKAGVPQGEGVPIDEMTRRAYIYLGLGASLWPQPVGQASWSSLPPNQAAREALYGAMLTLADSGLPEEAEPLYHYWLSLGEEDVAALGEEGLALKEELEAEEREYNRRVQQARERWANAGTAQEQSE